MTHRSQDWHGQSVHRSLLNHEYNGGYPAQRNLATSCKDSAEYVRRLDILTQTFAHNGCVNSVQWDSSGEYVLSGSDDQFLAISHPHTKSVVLKYKTAHNVNIFSCRFMPQSNDLAVVSCSGDGVVLHTEFMAPYALNNGRNDGKQFRHSNDVKENYFSCHKTGTAYDVMTLPYEPRCFLSCGEDGTVRFFDLRCISRCSERQCSRNMLIVNPSGVNAMDVAPINHHLLAIGCADSIVRLYDRRNLTVINSAEARRDPVQYQTQPLKAFPIPSPENRLYRTTCVKFSPDESELLVNYSSDYLYLYDLKHEGFDAVKLFASGRYQSRMSGLPRGNNTGPRLRLRGDWSDTGPNARPEVEIRGRHEIGQVRPPLQANVMSRIADVISRILSDPTMRRGLMSLGGVNPEVEAPPPQAAVALRPRQPRPPVANGRGSAAPAAAFDGPVAADDFFDPFGANFLTRHLGGLNEANSTPAAGAPAADAPAQLPPTNGQANIVQPFEVVADNAGAMPSASNDRQNHRHAGSNGDTPPASTHDPSALSSSITLRRAVLAAATNEHDDPAIVPVASSSVVRRSSRWRRAIINTIVNQSAEREQGNGTATSTLEQDNTEEGAAAAANIRVDENEDHSYVRMKFTGHRNSRTMIKSACFWGTRYVMSGSDCGHIFVWERKTGKLVKLIEADQHVVNRVVPHPNMAFLISSGIDYDIKLWAPIDDHYCFPKLEAEDLMRRNAVMLRETMDTITVPAPMLIRLLTGIHTLRSRNRSLFGRYDRVMNEVLQIRDNNEPNADAQ